MKTFKRIKNNKGGFTLIETMVAIFILSMALIALLGVISSSLFYAKYSRNEITANYLLQEVIDSVKNDRSSGILIGANWETFTNKYTLCAGNGCEIDAKSGDIEEQCQSGCNSLKYDESADDGNGSFYNYTSGVTSNFNRKVVITTNGDELDVTVTVSWKNGSVTKTRSLSSSILNWQ